jgi:hypothetical protein
MESHTKIYRQVIAENSEEISFAINYGGEDFYLNLGFAREDSSKKCIFSAINLTMLPSSLRTGKLRHRKNSFADFGLELGDTVLWKPFTMCRRIGSGRHLMENF